MTAPVTNNDVRHDGNAESSHRRSSRVDDAAFRWALSEDPSLESWRCVLAAWVRQCVYRGPAMQHACRMLDYLLAHPDVTRDPYRFCAVDYVAPMGLDTYLRRHHPSDDVRIKLNNGLVNFFDWWISRGVGEGLLPDIKPVSALRMPLRSCPGMKDAAQSHRDAMPSAVVDALVCLITRDDYAWPKSLREDWTRTSKKEWCPVRAVALLAKLMLGLRTKQVRYLESSEGDPEYYTPAGWKPNPAMPRDASFPRARSWRGVLHRFEDNGESFTGFFINTNKFFDRTRYAHDPGHKMRLSRAAMIEAIYRLEVWQRTHNRVAHPTRWSDLRDPSMRRRGPGAYDGFPPAYFLFRDPNSAGNVPLSAGRLNAFWLKALDALEHRINAGLEPSLAGFVGPLITVRNGKKLVRGRYDLHTLRVSFITTLLDEGEVPLEIVSELVGHATVEMTSRYRKSPNRRTINLLAGAEVRIAERSADNLANHRPEAPTLPATAWVADALPAAIATDAPGVTCTTGPGVCPVGRNRCHYGGPVGTGGVHGPVPPTAERCFHCRFFLSGPAYLPALIDRFNTLSTRFRREIGRYWRSEYAMRAAEDAQNPSDGAAQVDVAKRSLAAAQCDLDAIQRDWVACFRWVLRALSQTRKSPSGTPIHFVRGGDLDDWIEAQAVAHEPEMLRSMLDGATVQQLGPFDLRKALRVAERWVVEHRVGDGKGEAPPLVLAPTEADAAADASAQLLRRLARARSAHGLRRDVLGLTKRRSAGGLGQHDAA